MNLVIEIHVMQSAVPPTGAVSFDFAPTANSKLSGSPRTQLAVLNVDLNGILSSSQLKAKPPLPNVRWRLEHGYHFWGNLIAGLTRDSYNAPIIHFSGL